jgi:predicted amidohydrolase YtcJ
MGKFREWLIKKRDEVFEAHRLGDEARLILSELDIEPEETAQMDAIADVLAILDEQEQKDIPLKSYREQGIPVAFGADPPAFSLWQPQYSFWEAVARTTKGSYSFAPEETISVRSVREALRMQTMGSGYSAFQEKEIGSLEKGILNDLVIWDRNLYTIPNDQIRGAKAEITMVGSKIMYERKPNTPSGM